MADLLKPPIDYSIYMGTSSPDAATDSGGQENATLGDYLKNQQSQINSLTDLVGQFNSSVASLGSEFQTAVSAITVNSQSGETNSASSISPYLAMALAGAVIFLLWRFFK